MVDISGQFKNNNKKSPAACLTKSPLIERMHPGVEEFPQKDLPNKHNLKCAVLQNPGGIKCPLSQIHHVMEGTIPLIYSPSMSLGPLFL